MTRNEEDDSNAAIIIIDQIYDKIAYQQQALLFKIRKEEIRNYQGSSLRCKRVKRFFFKHIFLRTCRTHVEISHITCVASFSLQK